MHIMEDFMGYVILIDLLPIDLLPLECLYLIQTIHKIIYYSSHALVCYQIMDMI